MRCEGCDLGGGSGCGLGTWVGDRLVDVGCGGGGRTLYYIYSNLRCAFSNNLSIKFTSYNIRILFLLSRQVITSLLS